jgi:hypothetical protein
MLVKPPVKRSEHETSPPSQHRRVHDIVVVGVSIDHVSIFNYQRDPFARRPFEAEGSCTNSDRIGDDLIVSSSNL